MNDRLSTVVIIDGEIEALKQLEGLAKRTQICSCYDLLEENKNVLSGKELKAYREVLRGYQD